MAQQLSTMSAQFNGNVATITAQQTAMANDMEAYASSVEFLGSEVEGAKASVTEAVETLTTADQALARRVSTLDAAAVIWQVGLPAKKLLESTLTAPCLHQHGR